MSNNQFDLNAIDLEISNINLSNETINNLNVNDTTNNITSETVEPSAAASTLTLRSIETSFTLPLASRASPRRAGLLHFVRNNGGTPRAILSPAAIHHSPRVRMDNNPQELLATFNKQDSINKIGKDVKKVNKSESDTMGCLICMDEFTDQRRAYPLPCTSKCTGASVHYRCIMAWFSQSSTTCPLCRGSCDPLALEPMEKIDFSDMAKMVMKPVPLDAGILRCYVKQVYRGIFKQYGYELYLQNAMNPNVNDNNVIENEQDRFLLAARKQIRSNVTTNYIICLDKECTEKNKVGRMGANFLGTVFTIYNNGKDPQKIAKIQDLKTSPNYKSEGENQNSTERRNNNFSFGSNRSSSQEISSDNNIINQDRTSIPNSNDASDSNSTNIIQVREELGCITYEANRTSVGPRKMRVVIPDVDENNSSITKAVRPTSRNERLLYRLNTGCLQDLRTFTNREPVFREDLGAYCLDFGGRVSMASVKNFQLIAADDPSMGNILQFGRVGQDMFTMDFQWPLSPFQAFAICLSSCDTKLACV